MREYFNPDWAEYTFGVVFTATWQAALLVVLAAALHVRAKRAAIRGMIWSACILGLALVPVLSLLVPHCFVAYSGSLEPLHFPTLIARPLTATLATRTIWTFNEGAWDDRVCRTLLYVWLAGVSVAILRLGWNWIDMVRLLRMARPVQCCRVQSIVQKAVGRLDRVLLLELDGLVGAICWQIHRPKLILTADTNRLSDAEIEMMVRHEWAHLQRSDPLMLFVQRLVEIGFWFHPMVWWASLQISKAREFICDDRVIESGHARSMYACCLGQLAVRFYSPVPLAPAGLGMVWTQHLVLQRVKRLMHEQSIPAGMTRLEKSVVAVSAALLIALFSSLRVDWSAMGTGSGYRWTAWPTWSADSLEIFGVEVRDYPLDAHRYDARERG